MIFDTLPADGLVFVHATPPPAGPGRPLPHPVQPALPGLLGDPCGVLLDESDLLELLAVVRGQWWVQEPLP